MDLSKAAALCLGLWSAWFWADQTAAAAVLPSSHRFNMAGGARKTLVTLQGHSKDRLLFSKESIGKSTVVPHEYMISLYKSLSSTENKEFSKNLTKNKTRANTITSFVDQGHDDLLPDPSLQKFLFDTRSLPERDEVVGAELQILRRFPKNVSSIYESENLVHLNLYTCPTGSQHPKLLDSRPADLLDTLMTRWEIFSVWKAVESRKHSGELLCFMLKIVSDLKSTFLQPVQLGFSREGQPPHQKALLVVSSLSKRRENLFKEIREKIKSMGNPKFLEPPDSGQQSIPKRRRKRTALPTRTNNGKGHGKKSKTRCSKKPLHVNFKELGWDDWIIAPLDYEAYHCEGMCDFPLRSHLEPTNHAIIQTLMNSMDPESTPPSCCVPSKLSPISILYIDSGNNVVYKQYEDMVVESCGCR
ncbi:hypothetical protein GDO86_010473 [Hymenochirus boettgeri]|uniref:TGF-beta family profile domain-containing protein n=1 Tax=Hymenochirus boettgeri TaxID=247094 RepID=A0A8T2JQM9_9PIPI|nr:hypothetical protein GDO86_010473 [Hymenochirus boettgeri]